MIHIEMTGESVGNLPELKIGVEHGITLELEITLYETDRVQLFGKPELLPAGHPELKLGGAGMHDGYAEARAECMQHSIMVNASEFATFCAAFIAAYEQYRGAVAR